MTIKKIIIAIASVGMSVSFAASAFAVTSASNTPGDTASKITCVGTAVNAREQALGTAVNAYTSSVNSAYSARATALQQAYSQTTLSAVKSAVKTAWSDFNKAVRSARKTWIASKNSAWSDYRKAAKACKAPLSAGDSANSVSEVAGQ